MGLSDSVCCGSGGSDRTGGEYWLSDEAWSAIEPLLPKNQPGARRVDDRRVISGIVHVLKSGSLEGLPRRLRPPDHDLQPLQPLEPARDPGPALRHTRRKPGRRGRPLHRRDGRPGASLGSWRQRGAQAQAIGRSRGGPTTEIHVLTDGSGQIAAFLLTLGNIADISAAPALLAAVAPRRLIADRGYDAISQRRALAERGAEAVIPSTRSRRRPIPHDPIAYRERNRIERAFCALEDWRRIATRYDRLARNFEAAVAIAATVLWWT